MSNSISKSDCEMLTLAAKAAGYTDPEFVNDTLTVWDGNNAIYWNPLDDDGDALRLANKLRMDILHNDLGLTVSVCSHCVDWKDEHHGDDVHSATRRAIVRVAAEMGGRKNGQ